MKFLPVCYFKMGKNFKPTVLFIPVSSITYRDLDWLMMISSREKDSDQSSTPPYFNLLIKSFFIILNNNHIYFIKEGVEPV